MGIMYVHLGHLAERLDQPHEPRLLAVLAALLSRKCRGWRRQRFNAADVRRHPQAHVHRLGHALAAHVAAEHHVEAHLARLGVRARLQADVVDVGVREVVARAGDGDVELARHVAPLGVAAHARLLVERDEVVERDAKRARVNHLVLVDARQRRAHHVAHVVKRRLEARLAARVQPVDDPVGVLDRDAAHLDVLAGGDVQHADVVAVRLDAVRVEAEAVRVGHTVGQPQPHHEAAGRPLVAMHRPTTSAR